MLLIRVFVSVDVESAVGADVILLEPRFEAVYMKVMFASQKEHLVAVDVRLKTNGAHSVWILLHHCLYRYLLEYLLSYSKLLLDLFVHVLIVELLKGRDIHAFNRRIVGVGGSSSSILVLVVILEYPLPLIVPVDEVQIVLARWIHLHWLVLLYIEVR